MDRLVTWIRWTALLVAVVGVGSCWAAVRPGDVGEVWRAVRLFVSYAASAPLVWVALVAMVGASWAARAVEDRLPRLRDATGDAVKSPRVIRSSAADSGEAPPQLAELPEAVRRQRQRDGRRLRLEAFLRGEPDVPSFVDLLFAAALEDGASDIHLQPSDGTVMASFRIAGTLREAARLPPAQYPKVVRRLKVMADLPPYETDRPQDGRLDLETSRGRVRVRFSAVPGRFGEKVVLRLAGDAALRDLEQLGLLERDLTIVREILAQPQGLVVLTGPTGSGKTTTLYSALSHLHRTRPGASLATIEEPIEIDLPFLAQTPVDRARGLGFAAALRSVLRQDPDVLMVGEVRDSETAGVAVQAGLTGHLIMTTLHADSVLGVFPRLVDLGVEPFLAASSTVGVVAQRLVRRLCSECRRPARPEPAVVARLRAAPEGDRLPLGRQGDDGDYHRADGCPVCSYSGVTGRLAVFEVLRPDAELRRQITRSTPLDAQRARLRGQGHRTLLEAAVERARRGEIALEEAAALAG